MSSNGSYERPTALGRGSKHNTPTGSQSDKSHHGHEQSGYMIDSTNRSNQQSSFDMASSTQGDMSANTDIDFQLEYEIRARAPWATPKDFIPRTSGFTPSPRIPPYRDSKARAPWAEPEDFIPRTRGFTPSSSTPRHDYFDLNPTACRLPKRLSSLEEKSDTRRNLQGKPRKPPLPTHATFPGAFPDLPQHPQEQNLDGVAARPQSLNACPSDSSESSREETRSRTSRIRRLRRLLKYFA
ncbi:hypothetical protein F5Y12DRAFT_39654 [Xylaria sp. FL1777]|nr:hypothetical protein F5Y12DRAFT_39654 [Xylaria sp. FL1777]